MTRKKRTEGIDGILLIDKPAGWTSHDVVAKVRRVTGQPRAGHAGTLDPFATGLLVVCLGRATRLTAYAMAHEKVYEAEALLGVETATGDPEGPVVATGTPPELDAARVAALERAFTGRILQVPPAYSAVKVGGQRAYALARQGEAPELEPREVEIHELRIVVAAPDVLRLTVRCGPGTYIRSLARDIGRELGCGAHLRALRRVASGRSRVDDAVTLDRLERAVATGTLDRILLPPDACLEDRDAAILGTAGASRFLAGSSYRTGQIMRASDEARVYSVDGQFLGIGRVLGDGEVRPAKVLGG